MKVLAALLGRLRGGGSGAALSRATVLSLSLKISGAGLTFGLQVLVARLLGVESFGDYILALTWINVLVALGALGTPMGAIRFIPSYLATADWGLLRGFLIAALKVVLVGSVVLAVGLVGGLSLFGGGIRESLALTFVAGAVLIPVNALTSTVGTSLQALRHILLAEGPASVLRPLLVAIAVLAGASLYGQQFGAREAMLATLFASVGVLIFMSWCLFRRLPAPVFQAASQTDYGQWTPACLSFMIILLSAFINERTDVLMIGLLRDAGDAGIYSVAARNAQLLAFGLASVNALLGPMISRFHAEGDTAQLQRVLTLGAWGACAIAVPGALVLVGAGDWLLGLFGEPFREGYTSLVILVLSQLATAMFGSAGGLVALTGHNRAVSVVLGAGLGLNVVLNFALVPSMGIDGAAVATLVAMFLSNLVLVFWSLKRLGLNTTAFRMNLRGAGDP